MAKYGESVKCEKVFENKERKKTTKSTHNGQETIAGQRNKSPDNRNNQGYFIGIQKVM
jgi:hypothetical protein